MTRNWKQKLVTAIRSLSVKLATVIRWLSVLMIAVGVGIAVARSGDEGLVFSMFLYCLTPSVVGFVVAHIFGEFGRRAKDGVAEHDE